MLLGELPCWTPASSHGADLALLPQGAYASLTNLVTRSRVTPIGDSLPHAFKAMRAHRVKRIIALSTPSSCVLPDDKVSLSCARMLEATLKDLCASQWSWTWWSAITFPDVVVPQGHAEMSKIAEMVSAQDDFDWTVFRVMFLTNGSAENTVHAASVLTPDFPGSTTISRASFGRWVLDEIASPKHIKDKPVLGN